MIIDDIINNSIPRKNNTGIYFLIDKGEIVYVGQSAKILTRVSSHMNGKLKFDSWYFIPYRKSQLKKIERAYIVKFHPKYNLSGKVFKKKPPIELLESKDENFGLYDKKQLEILRG